MDDEIKKTASDLDEIRRDEIETMAADLTEKVMDVLRQTEIDPHNIVFDNSAEDSCSERYAKRVRAELKNAIDQYDSIRNKDLPHINYYDLSIPMLLELMNGTAWDLVARSFKYGFVRGIRYQKRKASKKK